MVQWFRVLESSGVELTFADASLILAVGFLAGIQLVAFRVGMAAGVWIAPCRLFGLVLVRLVLVGLLLVGLLLVPVVLIAVGILPLTTPVGASPARELVRVRACFEKKVVNTRMSKQAGARIGRGRVSVGKRTEYTELF